MTVEELIEKLKEFEPSMQVQVGADGVFQGSPREEDFLVQDTPDGRTVVIWAGFG